MNFAQNLQAFKTGLFLMGFGMAGIFIVLLLIFVSIKVLLKIFPAKN